MNKNFISSVISPTVLPETALWFLFRGDKLLVQQKAEVVSVPLAANPESLGITAVIRPPLYLGYLNSNPPLHCYAAELPADAEATPNTTFQGLRSLYAKLDEELFWVAGRAVQIVDWDRNHQFCGRCGTPTTIMPSERARKCPSCHLTNYPRLSPAMIVRVEKRDENGRFLLLARANRFPPGFYSVLAGFVEPGETLEQCVAREVREEVGIEVKNINYFGSQPWPFPNSLMIAFTAEFASGDITLDETEILEAGWYSADSLPQIPPPLSIARRLIDDFCHATASNQ